MAGVTAAQATILKPQKGFQEKFLGSSADIVFGGGAAGAGKTYALLLEGLRYKDNPKFSGIIFRRTTPQIRNAGGLWDTAQNIYPLVGADPKEVTLKFNFPSGANIKFSHLQHEKDKLEYQGSQIAFIGFDEVTHFTQSQFFYLMSRNRSTSGVKPYIRATCNPDSDSWVRRFIDWWVDKETGFIIKERDGVIRYFTRDGDAIVWGDSPQEVIDKCPHIFNNKAFEGRDITTLIKSFTFIEGDIYENEELLDKDPGYLANLLAQDEEDRMRLLDKNWNVKPDGRCIYNHKALLNLFTNKYLLSDLSAHQKYITCDAARFGSDKAVIKVWHGWVVIDIAVFDISKTTQIADKIKEFEVRHKVQRTNVAIDSDGVGGGVVDLLPNSYGFVNNATPIDSKEWGKNYQNLKVQCYYVSADFVNKGLAYVTEEVANTKVGNEYLENILARELRVVKRDKIDADGKLYLIPKEEMKNSLGHSPDFADTFSMRGVFELKKNDFFVI